MDSYPWGSVIRQMKKFDGRERTRISDLTDVNQWAVYQTDVLTASVFSLVGRSARVTPFQNWASRVPVRVYRGVSSAA